MLEFPFYSFGLFGFLFIALGLIALIQSFYQIKNGEYEKESSKFRIGFTIFGGLIFFLVGLISLISIFWSVYNFKHIDISKVKGLKVIKSDNEYDVTNSRFVVYDDAQSVQNILSNLKNCYETSRNHESYSDGYKFQILFYDESLEKDFYISVYRKSNSGKDKFVVIPHYYQNKNLNLGDFGCPTFQDWIQKNIDPLFASK